MDRATGSGSSRRPGGIQPDGLSLDRVVEAGRAIVRRDGLSALTVRAVADELGVTAPALYYHVPGGKQALIDLVVERVLTAHRPAPEPVPGESWIDRLERDVLRVASVETEFPGVMPYVMSAGSDLATYAETAEEVLRVLVDDAGLSLAEAARALAALTAHVIGWTAYRPPSPVALARAGHGELAMAVRQIGDADPAETLRTGIRALLEGLQITRGA
jgi:AcrR family transcriptional regulator